MQSRDLELDPSTEPSRRADGSSRRRRIVLTCAAVLAFPAAMGALASLTTPRSADPPPKAPPASAAPSRVPAPAGPTRVPAPPVSSVAAPAKRPTGIPYRSKPRSRTAARWQICSWMNPSCPRTSSPFRIAASTGACPLPSTTAARNGSPGPRHRPGTRPNAIAGSTSPNRVIPPNSMGARSS